MSANTSPDNIVYPVSTDAVAPLETVFANLANSVQDALDDVNDHFEIPVIATYGVPRFSSTGARSSAIPSPTSGMKSRLTTELFDRIYLGGNWIVDGPEASMLPQSVGGTGVTLDSASGIVSFSGSTSISVNAPFALADFNEYRVIVDITSASGAPAINFRLRSSGTDLSSSVYDQLLETVSGTSIAVTSPATTTSGRIGQAQTTGGHINARFVRPLTTANPKLVYGDGEDPTPVKQRVTNSIASATAYSGFTLIPSTGNITGTVRVIGVC
jgi:hypothetical protein